MVQRGRDANREAIGAVRFNRAKVRRVPSKHFVWGSHLAYIISVAPSGISY